jgi:hypothetical protein
MSGEFEWTPEWQAKLTRTTELAEQASEGSVFFLEMSRADPICSMYIKTGSTSSEDAGKKEVHLVVEQEPRTYPYFPATKELVKSKAYEEYLRRAASKNGGSVGTVPNMMTRSTYYSKFLEVTKIVDDSIQDTHGIMCHHDGDLQNFSFRNVYVLHVCDVMNIHMRKKKGLRTNLLISTQLLNEIADTTSNALTQLKMNDAQLSFFEDNIDYYYRLYCYYANFSYVPIRTEVDRHCTIFKLSRFFMNDSFYVKHQRGKLQEFNQMNTTTQSRVAYRSI